MAAVTVLPKLPPRDPNSHKGTYGRVLVVAGSAGMSGAAVLTGSAALRGGAGLVTVACPVDIQPVVAVGNPCYTTFGFLLPDDLAEPVAACDVFAIGPGLGRRAGAVDLVHRLIERNPSKPTVIDADGLNNLPTNRFHLSRRPAPLVLTPHPGEFATLVGQPIAAVQANRESLAVKFARTMNAVLLLKGHRTIVTDGDRIYTNATGNPGMATGGCGDVLTGVLAALLARMPAFDAACLAAHVHGRAGDLAARAIGQTALVASDLLDYLGPAFQELETVAEHPSSGAGTS
jgi:ADP-dependent NAD(P)H-hydrate dehydratase